MTEVLFNQTEGMKPQTAEETGARLVNTAYRNGRFLEAELFGEEVHELNGERVTCAVVMVKEQKGLIPFDLMDVKDARQLDNMIGSTIRFKVIRVHDDEQLFMADRKAAMAKTRERAWERLAAAGVGATTKAVVRYVNDNYLVVQVEGIETNIHVSEYGYDWVDDLRDHVSVEDIIQVAVTEIDVENQTLSLSRKATLPDPWHNVGRLLAEGSTYVGEVVGTSDKGMYIKLAPGITGMGNHPINEVVNVGDRVVVRCVRIDHKQQHVRVTFRRIQKRANL